MATDTACAANILTLATAIKGVSTGTGKMNDWHQGMEQLQQLASRQNGLEEQLRQLDETPSQALTTQTDMHLNQLLNRYVLIKQKGYPMRLSFGSSLIKSSCEYCLER